MLLVKMVMRRVLTLITRDDDGRDYSPVKVLKEILIGLVWGLIVIVCLIFLDCEFMALSFLHIIYLATLDVVFLSFNNFLFVPHI